MTLPQLNTLRNSLPPKIKDDDLDDKGNLVSMMYFLYSFIATFTSGRLVWLALIEGELCLPFITFIPCDGAVKISSF